MPISERPITSGQVRAIHVALSRQAIADTEYRAILDSRYGVSTCKDLTRRQASELLRTLGRPLPAEPREPAPDHTRRPSTGPLPDNAVRLASQAQQILIAELAETVEWRAPDGYSLWLRANQHIARVATDYQARRVIEALKAMLRRQRRAAHA